MILAPARRRVGTCPISPAGRHLTTEARSGVRPVAEILPTDAAQVVPDTRALSVIRRKYRNRNQILLLIRFPGILCALARSVIAHLAPCIHPPSAQNSWKAYYHGFRGVLFSTGVDASSAKPELLLFQALVSADFSSLKRRSPGPEPPGNHRLSLVFLGLSDLLPEIRDKQKLVIRRE